MHLLVNTRGPYTGAPLRQSFILIVFHLLPRLIFLFPRQHVSAPTQQHDNTRKDGALRQRAQWGVDGWCVGRGRAGEGGEWVRRRVGGGREEVGEAHGWR